MIRGFTALYQPRFIRTIVRLLQDNHYRALPFLRVFWHTQSFADIEYVHDFTDTLATQRLRLAVSLGIVGQLLAAVCLIILGHWHNLTGGVLFGLALLVSYPLVWAHLLAITAGLRSVSRLLRHPKKLGRSLVCRVLEHQVRALLKQHELKIVAVVGSVGKTSTKLAIAKVLESQFTVRYQVGNYNDRVTVPLIFFAQKEPNILNVFAWFRIFIQNNRALHRPYPYEVVVVELGTDGPGFMAEFGYLPVDIAVVCAITPEHMEFFQTMDAVAAEELAIFDFAQTVVVNGDDVAAHYLTGRRFKEYSLLSQQADYRAEVISSTFAGQELRLRLANGRTIRTTTAYVGEPGARFALAAAAVADQLDMEASEIGKAVKRLEPFAGRMQILAGVKDSVLLDDTYNASPVAVKAALDVVYAAKTKQRIAILGSMNELGDYSAEAHREVGRYCDPKKLDLVVTIGNDANKYLAPTARKRGCEVKTCRSPYEAGKFVKDQLKAGAIVLAKGSQNRVFAEEALKTLLANPTDASRLVRQSKYWLKQKQAQFSD